MLFKVLLTHTVELVIDEWMMLDMVWEVSKSWFLMRFYLNL